MSTPYIVDEHIYGADSEGVLRCLRLDSGQQVWQNESAVLRNRWATIHMVRNADRTWLFNERGELIIAKLTPKGFNEISRANKIINTIELQFSPTNVGMEPVYWNGPKEPALLFNGGWLWDMQQGKVWQLSDLPPPNGGKIHRMGFYHVIPANLIGDSREEMVIWDPTATHIYIYTPKLLNDTHAPKYYHGPKQYNPRLMD